MVEVSTSILSVLKETSIKTFYDLEAGHTDYFHIDVMDGKFVSKDTSQMMLQYAEQIKQISNLPLDVHLMVEDVLAYVNEYLILHPNIITFHLEALNDKKKIMDMIQYIKENNCKVGLSIKPNTPIGELYSYLPYIHMVLVMTVEPGEGGQPLLPHTIEKIKNLKKYIEKNTLDIDIEADGGINLQTVEKIKQAGANMIVAGTAVINSGNYKETISKLKE